MVKSILPLLLLAVELHVVRHDWLQVGVQT